MTTCFGHYHQAIIWSQVNNRTLRKLYTVIHKNESYRLEMKRDVVVILYGSIYTRKDIGIDTTVQNNDNEISLHFNPYPANVENRVSS